KCLVQLRFVDAEFPNEVPINHETRNAGLRLCKHRRPLASAWTKRLPRPVTTTPPEHPNRPPQHDRQGRTITDFTPLRPAYFRLLTHRRGPQGRKPAKTAPPPAPFCKLPADGCGLRGLLLSRDEGRPVQEFDL